MIVCGGVFTCLIIKKNSTSDVIYCELEDRELTFYFCFLPFLESFNAKSPAKSPYHVLQSLFPNNSSKVLSQQVLQSPFPNKSC